MKKRLLAIISVFMLVFALSCREDKSAGEKVEDGMEEVGDDIEEGVDEVGDEIDDATDDN